MSRRYVIGDSDLLLLLNVGYREALRWQAM